MKLSKYAKPNESLYETVERAMRSGRQVWGEEAEGEGRFATINAAIEHANTYGIETISVRGGR